MIRVNVDELWEQARQQGALTPEIEAQMAKERAEGVEILLDDLDNKDYIQMKLSVDDMNDEQLNRMLEHLSPQRLAGLAGYLTPTQLKRVQKLVKSPLQIQLLQLLSGEQNPPT